MESIKDLHAAMTLLDRRRDIFKLEYYTPYKYQKSFHHALGLGTQFPAVQRVLIAANQVGKTLCAAAETAMHLTGRYPDWWKGYRFYRPILGIVGGKTNETLTNICQKELFGDPVNPQKLGTGMIPLECVGKRTTKPGVPNAYDNVMVRYVNGGWSKVLFRSYDQGKDKHMGIKVDLGWLDEEPPQEIWSQYLRATISTHGILYMTFTPEDGLTEVVTDFMHSLKKGQALLNATWEDAPHLVSKTGEMTERAKQLWQAFPAHERDMRSKGIPMFGTGLVFPFTDEQIVVDPIEIPRHWPQIVGIDFGHGHPFGAAKLAWDRDSDIVYVTADYREEKVLPAVHAAAIQKWGRWIPVAWPRDGLEGEKTTGIELKKSYEDEGLLLLPRWSTNPPQAGQTEGEGGISVEASILAMYERMETGRWKVFRTCRNWLEEQRIYHRNEGKIVKKKDDVISASRAAAMMLRHARTETIRRRPREMVAGASNW